MLALVLVAVANFALMPRSPGPAPQSRAEAPVLEPGVQALPANEAPSQRRTHWGRRGLIGPSPSPLATAGTLVVPVEGVTRAQLADTWGQSRSEGRRHEGIDILAPEMTPVRAVADGRLVRFFESVRGGITIYQFDASERYVYYYAHLNARARGLAEDSPVRQGDVIGYVGMTGNAPVPHLHFEIQRLTDEKHWWEATSLNPYPYLVAGTAPE